MKKMHALSIMLIIGASMSISLSTYAANYLQGYSSVDGREIRWGGSTSYMTIFNSSVSTWNILGKVNIAPDTVFTIQDLDLSDYSDTNTLVAARYGYRGAYTSGLLQFNTYQMNKMTTDQKVNASTHELGHALGLAHSVINNIMYYSVTGRTTLGAQDRVDYQYLYGM